MKEMSGGSLVTRALSSSDTVGAFVCFTLNLLRGGLPAKAYNTLRTSSWTLSGTAMPTRACKSAVQFTTVGSNTSPNIILMSPTASPKPACAKPDRNFDVVLGSIDVGRYGT